MLPDRVSNPGPVTYESGALPIALRGPAWTVTSTSYIKVKKCKFLLKNGFRKLITTTTTKKKTGTFHLPARRQKHYRSSCL